MGRKKVQRKCGVCGNNFYVEERYAKRGQGKFCSLSCSAKYGHIIRGYDGGQYGDKNTNWKGGRSKHSYRNYGKKYKKNNPEKAKAHLIVHRAIKSGKIERCPCIVCGEQNAHAHHKDYAYPLEVTWLCMKHHVDLHNNKFCLLDTKLTRPS